MNYSMSSLSPGTTPAKTAHIAFVKLANAFEQIDQEMLTEMQEDIQRCLQPSDELHPEVWSSSRFSDTQVHKDKGVEDIKQSVSHTQSEVETLRYLADTTCLRAWSWVHQVLLEYQGLIYQHERTSWTLAKSRAERILNFAQAVLEIYESKVCQNLFINGHENTGLGVELKLRALLPFHDIYARPKSGENAGALYLRRHDFRDSFSSFLSRRKRKSNPSNNEVAGRTHQDVSPHLACPTSPCFRNWLTMQVKSKAKLKNHDSYFRCPRHQCDTFRFSVQTFNRQSFRVNIRPRFLAHYAKFLYAGPWPRYDDIHVPSDKKRKAKSF